MLNQAVELFKTRPVKLRLFEQLSSNMDSQRRRLLLHTEVRWLSKGKVHMSFDKSYVSFLKK